MRHQSAIDRFHWHQQINSEMNRPGRRVFYKIHNLLTTLMIVCCGRCEHFHKLTPATTQKMKQNSKWINTNSSSWQISKAKQMQFSLLSGCVAYIYFVGFGFIIRIWIRIHCTLMNTGLFVFFFFIFGAATATMWRDTGQNERNVSRELSLTTEARRCHLLLCRRRIKRCRQTTTCKQNYAVDERNGKHMQEKLNWDATDIHSHMYWTVWRQFKNRFLFSSWFHYYVSRANFHTFFVACVCGRFRHSRFAYNRFISEQRVFCKFTFGNHK